MSARLQENPPFLTLAPFLAWLSTFGALKTVHSVWCGNSTKIFNQPLKIISLWSQLNPANDASDGVPFIISA